MDGNGFRNAGVWRGIRLFQLVAALGWPAPVLSAIENRKRRLSDDEAAAIRAALTRLAERSSSDGDRRDAA
jgi:hypothetical protein